MVNPVRFLTWISPVPELNACHGWLSILYSNGGCPVKVKVRSEVRIQLEYTWVPMATFVIVGAASCTMASPLAFSSKLAVLVSKSYSIFSI